MDTFDDIQGLLDTIDVVTVKYLAGHLKCSILDARSAIQKFHERFPSSRAHLVISGKLLGSNTRTYAVIDESDLDVEKAKFGSIGSISIYSLQVKSIELDTFCSLVSSLNIEQITDLVMNPPPGGSSHHVRNDIGCIQCSSLVVADVGKRQRDAFAVAMNARDAVSTSSSVSSSFATAKSTSSSSGSASVNAAPKLPPKTVAAVSNFFAKAASAPAPAPAAKFQPTSSSSSTSSSTAKSTSSSGSTIDARASQPKPEPIPQTNDDDEAEWDDGTTYRPDKKKALRQRDEEIRLQNRQRLGITMDEEQDEEDSADAELFDVSDNAAGRKGKRKAKPVPDAPQGVQTGKFQVHGAMDTYFEDVSIQQEKERQAAAANGIVEESGVVIKKKKKKLVEKVFTDDKGYLVTQNVLVEVTDDEDDAPKNIKPAQSSSSSSSTGPVYSGSAFANKKTTSSGSTSSTASKKPASGGQQKGMLSFFAKK